MSARTDAAVAAALGLGTSLDGEGVEYSGVGTDTRLLEPGALFVALRGENHDAHAFMGAAAAAGARGAVVEFVPEDAPDSLRYYVVDDTLVALGRLARLHRRRCDVRVCAVVGSNGKTTTKELIRAVLETSFRVHATTGNLNNRVGLPLTLLACPADAEVVVAEMGTNVPGEIALLAAIAEPDVVVVANISAEHLEGLGDLDGVLREETSALAWLPSSGTAVVPEAPAVLPARARAMAPRARVVGFGPDADAGFRGTRVAVDDDGRVRFEWSGREVRLELRGRHNARNALLALAVARTWGVDDHAAVAALARPVAPKMRAEVKRAGELTVVVDCYNANPASVAAALELLSDMPRRGGRVAVLGSMLEMGENSGAVHADVARAAAGMDVDLIVATGEFAAAFEPHAASLGDRLILGEDPLAVWDEVSSRLRGDEVVLLKASRGIRLERLLPRIEDEWGMLHPHGEAFGSRASDEHTGARAGASPAEHSPANSAGGAR